MDEALCSPWYLTLAWQHWSFYRAGQLCPGFGGIGMTASIWRNVALCLMPVGARLVPVRAMSALVLWPWPKHIACFMEASVCCLGLAALACGRAVYWGLGSLTIFNFDIVCLLMSPWAGLALWILLLRGALLLGEICP